MARTVRSDLILLAPEDHFTLGEAQFGMPGLVAVESVGPFVPVKAVGPILNVHDSVIEAGLGIGHHPHRYNERLFYVERGTFDHDDALNHITGHIDEGGMARFTEGQRGMIHQEWNHGEVDAEIFILVAATEPVPARTSFEVLPRDDMPVYEEGPGVSTREMVGSRAPLPVHADIRTFTDTTLDAGTQLDWRVPAGEGGLLSVREGTVGLDEADLVRKSTAILPPTGEERTVTITTRDGARVIRTTFGRGHGLVVDR